MLSQHEGRRELGEWLRAAALMERGAGLVVNSNVGGLIERSGDGVGMLMLVLLFCGALYGNIEGENMNVLQSHRVVD